MRNGKEAHLNVSSLLTVLGKITAKSHCDKFCKQADWFAKPLDSKKNKLFIFCKGNQVISSLNIDLFILSYPSVPVHHLLLVFAARACIQHPDHCRRAGRTRWCKPSGTWTEGTRKCMLRAHKCLHCLNIRCRQVMLQTD